MATLPLECEDFPMEIPEKATNMVLIVVYDEEGNKRILKLKEPQDDPIFSYPTPSQVPISTQVPENLRIQEVQSAVGAIPAGCCLYFINGQYVLRRCSDPNVRC